MVPVISTSFQSETVIFSGYIELINPQMPTWDPYEPQAHKTEIMYNIITVLLQNDTSSIGDLTASRTNRTAINLNDIYSVFFKVLAIFYFQNVGDRVSHIQHLHVLSAVLSYQRQLSVID